MNGTDRLSQSNHNMKSVSCYCQGESHKSTDKPCQDYAASYSSDELSYAIVSDGHGGERYFRSQFGSMFAVKITAKTVKQFVRSMKDLSFTPKGRNSVFDEAGFTAYSAATSDGMQEETSAHAALRWLFSSIIAQWNEAIAEHARANDLSDWEKANVQQKYQDRFASERNDPDKTFEKTYGCTLMAYVQTKDYWFAFHIGDGKCVSFEVEGNHLAVSQPIPWDERCFLNKTTSLCDTDALGEFRYCYQGDGKFPVAVFLGSDGIDDSYGDGENLTNFYIEIFKLIATRSQRTVRRQLEKDLPVISKRGSKDDMSVACVYDDNFLQEGFNLFADYQEMLVKKQLEEAEKKEKGLQKKVARTESLKRLDTKARIELQYARNDLERVKAQIERCVTRLDKLKREYDEFCQKRNDRQKQTGTEAGNIVLAETSAASNAVKQEDS